MNQRHVQNHGTRRQCHVGDQLVTSQSIFFYSIVWLRLTTTTWSKWYGDPFPLWTSFSIPQDRGYVRWMWTCPCQVQARGYVMQLMNGTRGINCVNYVQGLVSNLHRKHCFFFFFFFGCCGGTILWGRE